VTQTYSRSFFISLNCVFVVLVQVESASHIHKIHTHITAVYILSSGSKSVHSDICSEHAARLIDGAEFMEHTVLNNTLLYSLQ
jgi:hypothetical protein